VIAVGDFDKSAIEPLIRSHFGSLPAASFPKPRATYSVDRRPSTRSLIVTEVASSDAALRGSEDPAYICVDQRA